MQVASRYELERLLGEGADAEVWLASDLLQPGRRLAVKLLRSKTDGAFNRFVEECRLLTRFRHEGLVALFEFGVDPSSGTPYAVLEHCEGADAVTALRSASEETVRAVFVSACRTLQFLHRRGLVHADLKPSHILVTPPGRVVILDLGLARETIPGVESAPAGTLPYMAPEVLRGAAPTPAADLYALGVILFQCLEGRLPFEGESPGALVQAHLKPERPRISDAGRTRGPRIATLCERLIALDPADRPLLQAVLDELHDASGASGDTGTEPLPDAPLIGRAEELQRASTWLDAVLQPDGNPRVLLIRGESGIGRSRFLGEVATIARLRGILVVEPGTTAPSAAQRLVQEVATRVPILFLFDDCDPGSEVLAPLLASVSAASRSARTGSVCALLPGAEPVDETLRVELTLGRLSNEQCLDLARAVVPSEWMDDPAIREMAPASKGIPLFLMETLRAVSRDRPRNGGALYLETIADIAPKSVDDVLLRRSAELSETTRNRLLRLAVGGVDIPVDLGRHLMGELDERVLDDLARASILIHTSRTSGRLMFDHHRLPDLLSGQLSNEERTRLHETAARWSLDAGEAEADRAAFHALASGDTSLILAACRAAARTATKRQAYSEAAGHLAVLLEKLPTDDPSRIEIELELVECRLAGQDFESALLQLDALLGRPALAPATRAIAVTARARALIRHRPSSSEGLQEAEAGARLALGAGDSRTALLATKEMATALARRGEFEQALPRFREALSIATDLEDRWRQSELLLSLGLTERFLNHLKQAEDYLHRAQRMAFDIGYKSILANSFHALAIVHLNAARLHSSLQNSEAAERLFAEIGSINSPECKFLRGEAHFRLGQYSKSFLCFSEVATLRRDAGDRGRLAYALDMQGDILRICGRTKEATERHQEALDISTADGDAVQQIYAWAALAQDRLAEGDRPGARDAAERAVLISAGVASQRASARASLVLAEVDLLDGEAGRALATTERALELRQQPGLLVELEAEALRLAARAHQARGPGRSSDRQIGETFTAALKIAEQLALPEEQAHVLAARADFEEGDGRPTASGESRRAAAAVIRRVAGRIGDAGLARDYVAVPWRAALLAAAAPAAESGPLQRRLSALYDLVASVNSLLDPQPLLEKIVDIAVANTGAERGLLILIDDDSGACEVKVARDVDRQTIADATRYSRSIVREAGTGRSILTIDAENDGRFKDFRSVSLLHIRSLMCVPLRLRSRIIGTVYLDSRLTGAGFSEEDLRFLEAFAHHAAIAIDNSRRHAELREENELLRKASGERFSFGNLIGRSRAMQQVFALLERAAESNVPVLIEGESGTGKELVAKALHFSGPRKGQPFVSQNVSAIPETLLESELFGHTRGAFTGADRDRRGLFEQSHHGSLFLDEIGDLPLSMQPKLLRVLQDYELRPLGGRRTVTVDVRVISATNRDLQELTRQGRFREDLFYRLNVLRVVMPPLRERREDIPLLVEHFLRQMAKSRSGVRLAVEDSVMALFLGYDWPGNVRQLQNILERLSVTSRGNRITRAAIEADPDLGRSFGSLLEPPPVDSLKDSERQQIRRALEKTAGNREQAARLLGISRATIFRKIREHRLG